MDEADDEGSEMGIGIVLGITALTLIVGIAAYYIASSAQGNIDTSFDRLRNVQITEVREGIPIPLIYGTCRVAANIVYYGNLTSIERSHEVEGGKGGGGGSQRVSEGYDYYCDLMQAIGYGKLVYVKHYTQDKDKDLEYLGSYYYNDGTMPASPDSVWGNYTKHEDQNFGSSFTGGTLTGGVVLPGTVHIRFSGADQMLAASWAAFDDSAGNLIGGIAGTINYETGVMTVSSPPPSSLTAYVSWGTGINIPPRILELWLALQKAPSSAQVGGGMAYETPLHGVAWAWIGQFYLGRNVTNVPTVHWVVRRELSTGLPHENMENGNNPAAVIYDLYTNTLYGVGKSPTEMNWASFVAASNYYYAKGYGINCCFESQVKVEQALEKIFGWVGGSVYVDNENHVAIMVFDENEASQRTFDEDDFIEFAIERPSWNATYNEVKGNFYDSNGDWATKSLVLRDPANIAMQMGEITSRTVDLTGFSDLEAVQKRLWEVLRNCTYPTLKVSFKTLLATAGRILPGNVITINHQDYGLSGLKCRVTEAEYNLVDNIEVSYKAEQMVEAATDLTFEPHAPVAPRRDRFDLEAHDIVYQAAFELPRNGLYKDVPNYAILVERPSMEEGVMVYHSLAPTSGYEQLATIHRFSQHGQLEANYPATTHPIDDEVGILYTPTRNWMNPDDYTRSNTFKRGRYLLIGNEIMKFQYHDPYGDGGMYQIRGIVRGVFGTPIEAHNDGDTVWITDTYDQIIPILTTSTFYLKGYTFVGENVSDPTSAPTLTVTPSRKAETPWPVSKIEATRDSSNNIVVTWWPRTIGYYGAGTRSEDAYSDTYPFNFDGDFALSLNYGAESFLSACSYSFTMAGSVTVGIRNRVNGVFSSAVYLVVGSSAGKYQTEVGQVTY